jgi:hypothetical protein
MTVAVKALDHAEKMQPGAASKGVRVLGGSDQDLQHGPLRRRREIRGRDGRMVPLRCETEAIAAPSTNLN